MYKGNISTNRLLEILEQEGFADAIFEDEASEKESSDIEFVACELCKKEKAALKRVFLWEAVLSLEVVKNTFFSVLSTLNALLAVCLPVWVVWFRDIQAKIISFSTVHSLCKNCNTDYKKKYFFNKIALGLLKNLFFALLLSVFVLLLGSIVTWIYRNDNAYSRDYLPIWLTAFAISSFLSWLTYWIKTKIQKSIKAPAEIQGIARGKFHLASSETIR